MTLRISYFVPSAPLLAARERGLLDGIDLIEMRTPGSPAQLAGLATGELDLVVTAIDNLFEWTAAVQVVPAALPWLPGLPATPMAVMEPEAVVRWV